MEMEEVCLYSKSFAPAVQPKISEKVFGEKSFTSIQTVTAVATKETTRVLPTGGIHFFPVTGDCTGSQSCFPIFKATAINLLHPLEAAGCQMVFRAV